MKAKDRIKVARMYVHMAQNTAWRELGLRGLNDLIEFENGETLPSNAVYKRMAKLYKIDVDWLISGR
jgi:transcriptional regulator with XRE-family HTH domain